MANCRVCGVYTGPHNIEGKWICITELKKYDGPPYWRMRVTICQSQHCLSTLLILEREAKTLPNSYWYLQGELLSDKCDYKPWRQTVLIESRRGYG